MGQALAVMQELIRLARMSGQETLVKKLEDRFKAVEQKYYSK
jgi:hypothetical protein